MKKIIALTWVSISILFASCSDFLDVPDYGYISPEIWNSEQSATLYVNNLYSYMNTTQAQFLSGSPWGANASLTEEVSNGSDYSRGEVATGSTSVVWGTNTYAHIREMNIGLDGLSTSSMPESAKLRLEAEIRFIRAWKYWNMVLVHGGVPIVTDYVNPYTDPQEKTDPPRNKTSECIKFICDELDFCALHLPQRGTVLANERVRVIRSAAKALKGRVLLYYASPQFNPNNDPSRWETAYQANKEALEFCKADGHALHPDFEQLFLEKQNPEVIMITSTYSTALDIVHGWENGVRPPVASDGGGRTCNPTWNMVEAFPMANGKAINDPTSGYDVDRFWMNRDQRFYKTIAYNGCTWEIEGMEYSIDGAYKPIKTIWTYTSSNTMTTTGTTSGFYCRKATDKSIPKESSKKGSSDFVEFRYAEVILNFAEAAIMAEKEEEAYTELKALRERAGIEPGDDGYYGMKSTYYTPIEMVMNERLVELAYENKRFWDLRRHKMYTQDLGPNTPKLNEKQRTRRRITAKSPYTAAQINAMDRDQIDIDTEYSTYFNIANVAETSTAILRFPERYEFFDIPANVINRSLNLVQTQGWGYDEEFNPYE